MNTYAVEKDTVLAVRAGRLFDGERSLGPGMVLVSGGRIVDVDTTGRQMMCTSPTCYSSAKAKLARHKLFVSQAAAAECCFECAT